MKLFGRVGHAGFIEMRINIKNKNRKIWIVSKYLVTTGAEQFTFDRGNISRVTNISGGFTDLMLG